MGFLCIQTKCPVQGNDGLPVVVPGDHELHVHLHKRLGNGLHIDLILP